MATYSPNVPQPNDIPAQSQDEILQNFQSIDDGTNGFSRNHISYLNATVGQRGKHKFLQMPEQSVAPATAVNEGGLYTQDDGTRTALFWRQENNGTSIKLTGPNPVLANNGYTFLPGNLLIQWGRLASSSATSRAVVFPTAFSAAPYVAIPVGFRAASDPGDSDCWVDSSSLSTTGFTIFNKGGHSFGFLWIAIGPRT